MKRRDMNILVSRFKKDGRLKVTKEHEEEDSNFWKADFSECLRYDDKKLEIEVLLMCDWWNREYHEKFEHLWNLLKNIIRKESS